MNESQLGRAARRSRQLVLPEVGPAGMNALSRAQVLVVGCGGLGSPVIQYLAAAGVGRLGLIDDDVVELSNLNRQTIHRACDVGRAKAERAAEWVRELDAEMQTTALVDRVSIHNAREMVREYDVVVDCTDGLGNKYLLNDACVLEKKHLVHGAVTAFSGQLMVLHQGAGPCLRCVFPQLPEAGAIQSCQEAGVLGAACGWVGSLMALEVIKLICNIAPSAAGRYVGIDLLTNTVTQVEIPRSNACVACGSSPQVTARSDADYTSSHCAM